MSRWRVEWLCIVVCAGCLDSALPTTKFSEAVTTAIEADSAPERLRALERARQIAERGELDPAIDCVAVAALSEAAGEFAERPARVAVNIFGMAACPESAMALSRAAAGDWAARSAVLRATALRTLVAGTRAELFASQSLPAQLRASVADPSDLLRAAAYDGLLVTTSPPEQGQWLLLAAQDDSAFVRRSVGARGLPGSADPASDSEVGDGNP